MKPARQIAYDVLWRVLYEGAYSNLALAAGIREGGLDRAGAAFCTALVYGVLERGVWLDAALEPLLSKGIASLDREVRLILQMGICQLCFFDTVPDRAAVDESVRLAGYARKTSAKSLVNAVLRGFLRSGKRLVLPEGADPLARLSVETSCPLGLLARLAEQYGPDRAESYARALPGRPPLFARVNTLKTTASGLAANLAAGGAAVEIFSGAPDCLLLRDTGDLETNPAYRQGLFHIQDLSSQLCVAALDPRPGETVADVCAAPGSKSFTAAQRMENRGQIYAFDLSEARCRLIREGARRLGITILEAAARDGAALGARVVLADRVLCDAPCSGLGVVRRKPEIKYRPPAGNAGLPALQLAILQNAAKCVKPGGRLVYSTCTLDRRENEAVAEEFLRQNNSFKPLQFPPNFCKIEKTEGFYHTFWPSPEGGDGFFVARFARG